MKQTMGPQLIRTYRAEGGAIGAGLAVMPGTAEDQAKLPTGANVRCHGVTALAVAAAGELLPVVEFGEVAAVADAAVAVGDLVMANAATGKIAPIGAVAATNYHVIGVAKSAAAAQNDEFLLLVMPSRAQG
jgi:hypothetical protein